MKSKMVLLSICILLGTYLAAGNQHSFVENWRTKLEASYRPTKSLSGFPHDVNNPALGNPRLGAETWPKFINLSSHQEFPSPNKGASSSGPQCPADLDCLTIPNNTDCTKEDNCGGHMLCCKSNIQDMLAPETRKCCITIPTVLMGKSPPLVPWAQSPRVPAKSEAIETMIGYTASAKDIKINPVEVTIITVSPSTTLTTDSEIILLDTGTGSANPNYEVIL